MSSKRIAIPTLEDDGLFTPEVGPWAEEKYELAKLYGTLFTTGIRSKWDELVYVDLFAGAGRSRVRRVGTDRVLPASPMLALTLDHPFDRYVFCESDEERMKALEERVRREFSGVDVRFVSGDVNQSVPAILAEMPPVQAGWRSLGFCFVDPFGLKDLRFATIAALSKRYMDFLVLVPSGYDATRNEGIYLSPDNHTIDRFLGNDGWRDEWAAAKARGQTFDRFMTDAFGRSMQRLRYIYEGIDNSHLVRSSEKKLRLYRLVLFSRDKLGVKFWRAVQKYAVPQGRLFD